MRRPAALFALLFSGACTSAMSGASSGTPADGRALLAQMHDRYATTWFRTLTFVQKTTQRRPDGTAQVSTWYEAQKGPRLRIDIGDPAQGNGALYTADSVYSIRAGKVVRKGPDGNPFLPLIVGVYIQPLDTTIAQIAQYKVNLSAIRLQDWEGRPTYVVGAQSASDTTSPQFWVDRERLIVTRFLMPLIPSPDSHAQDVRLEENVRVGGGWLATRIRMLEKGVAFQTEEYTDVHGDVPLADSFFQAEHWTEGPHWAKPARP